MASEVVEASGHLIDSGILNGIFDTVIRHDASFEVLRFTIGRTNAEPSLLSMRVTAPTDEVLRKVVENLVPLGCLIVSGQDVMTRAADRTAARRWTSTRRPITRHTCAGRDSGCRSRDQRMDAAIVVDGGRASCRKLRDIRKGDAVVCGVEGIRVVPTFQDRDRHGFAFMTNEVSSERRVEAAVARVAEMMQGVRADGGKIAIVAGPVVVHTGGAPYLAQPDSRRLRAGSAVRQRAGRARHRGRDVRDVARGQSRNRPVRRRRAPPPHARHQRRAPGRRLQPGRRTGHREVRHSLRVPSPRHRVRSRRQHPRRWSRCRRRSWIWSRRRTATPPA